MPPAHSTTQVVGKPPKPAQPLGTPLPSSHIQDKLSRLPIGVSKEKRYLLSMPLGCRRGPPGKGLNFLSGL